MGRLMSVSLFASDASEADGRREDELRGWLAEGDWGNTERCVWYGVPMKRVWFSAVEFHHRKRRSVSRRRWQAPSLVKLQPGVWARALIVSLSEAMMMIGSPLSASSVHI